MILNAVQVAEYAMHAGFHGTALVDAVAIAMVESSYNTNATNGPYIGLWQIWTGHVSNPQTLFNPQVNADEAYAVSDHGTNWSGWPVSYGEGYYLKYVPMAQKAVQQAEATLAPTVTPIHTSTGLKAVSVRHGKTDTIYLLYTVLESSGAKYTDLGNGAFLINGKKIQGVLYKGATYLPWYTIPGVSGTVGKGGTARLTIKNPVVALGVGAVGIFVLRSVL